MIRKTSILTAILLLLAAPANAANDRDEMVTFQDYSKAKSEGTYDLVESGMSTIPKEIRKALVDGGYQVLIAPTMLSAMPGWEGAAPRGWREDSNYDNVGGLFQPTTKRIIIPEQLQSRKSPNTYSANSRANFTIRHEIGHAYDDFQGNVSRSDDFTDAYTRDADKLDKYQEEQFAYFLQPNGAGFQELFAELFAAAYTPDAENESKYKNLLKSFPRTTALMMKLNPNRPKSTAAKKPPESTQSSASAEKTRLSETETERQKRNNVPDPFANIKQLHASVAEAYAKQDWVAAERAMKPYVEALEYGAARGTYSKDRLRQTYLSYADVLQRVHKPLQAKEVYAKANNLARTNQVKAPPSTVNAGFVGIKFVIDSGYPIVNECFEGSPARKAGIQSDDQICAVDGKSTLGLNRDQIYDLIIGPVGTSVSVTVSRRSETLVFKLTRAALNKFASPSVQHDYQYGDR
jgi:hypothetical protein